MISNEQKLAEINQLIDAMIISSETVMNAYDDADEITDLDEMADYTSAASAFNLSRQVKEILNK